tara:strand:- start:1218 stop:1424 length:207 start_codon:yes stop_codon:yes gene_type:complete
MSKWHYQLMKRNFDGEDNYAVHEYYRLDDGDVWSHNPVEIDGESVEDVKKMLQMIIDDIDKHGVKDFG